MIIKVTFYRSVKSMTKKQNSVYVNDFITRSFRDNADKDYILARIACKYKLEDQFFWSAL